MDVRIQPYQDAIEVLMKLYAAEEINTYDEQSDYVMENGPDLLEELRVATERVVRQTSGITETEVIFKMNDEDEEDDEDQND